MALFASSSFTQFVTTSRGTCGDTVGSDLLYADRGVESPAYLSGWTRLSDFASSACLALRVDPVNYSQNGKFGKNGIDFVQHGPIMCVTFRW